MDALRRYLSHYCRCDEETIARHVAAEASGHPLALPQLAEWCRLNLGLLELAAYQAHLVALERVEREATAKVEAEASRALAASKSSKVLAPRHKPGSAAARRHHEIMSSWPAKLRPERAAQLAADRTVSPRDAGVLLSNMMTPAEVHAWNMACAPAGGVDTSALCASAPPVAETSGGFGPSFEAMPRSASERAAADIEQFKAIVRALPATEGGRNIRMHV